MSTGKLNIYKISGSMCCAKNKCNTMIIVPSMHQHTSSGANRPSDVTVTVTFNAQFNVMPVNSKIECFSRDQVPEYCLGLEASAVSTAPPFFVESLHGRSNRSLPRLLLHMHAEDIIPTFLTSNIYIGLFLPKALTLTRLRLYEMFKVLRIVRMNKGVGLRRILNIHLLGDAFPSLLVRGILLKKGVPYPLQSKVRTPPPHLR
jgi:hypothetical protein